MICYYHRDLDGMCSGFWVALLADKHDIYRDRYIECDYRKKTPVEMVKPGEQVFIVDCSIDPKEMESMFNVTTDITWIDHHQSAIDKYWDFPIEIAGVRKEGIAACMLTFCYLKDLRIKAEKIHGWVYSSFLDLKDDAPYFTALIADYDTFKFKYGMDTRYFQLGASSLDLSPLSKEWDKFTTNSNREEELIEDGKIIMKYRDQWTKEYMEMAFEVEFEGYKCIVANIGHAGSDYFKSLMQEHDIIMPYVFDGEKYVFSMYTKDPDINLSAIAMKYGGGGHAMAAGFNCMELPFSVGRNPYVM